MSPVGDGEEGGEVIAEGMRRKKERKGFPSTPVPLLILPRNKARYT